MIKEDMLNEIILGDCLEVMKQIPDGSVDMILADLPYGTTSCKWDSIIPFEPLWDQYKRIIKERGAIVLTAAQPFTSALVMSNPEMYRHNWYWNKENGGSPLSAKYRPMSVVEDVLVFGKKAVTYYPAMVESLPENRRPRGGSYKRNSDLLGSIGSFKASEKHNEKLRYPKNLLTYNNRKGELNPVNRSHPTQKPVALFEYLIRTYTNEGESVLDNVIGSGTTAVAAINTSRNFIGIEKESEYVEIAKRRIDEAIAKKGATHDRINDRYALLGGGVVQYGINNRRDGVNMADEAKLAEIMRELEKHVAAGEDIRIETAWRENGWRQYVIDIWPVQRKEGD